MTSISLRAAAPGDAKVVARLLGELGYPTAPGDVPARLEAVVSEGGAVLLASQGDDEPAGLLALARHKVIHAPGPVAYITGLVTAPEARGRGIGRAMVEAAADWARSENCVKLSVTSAEHRGDAHAFYPSCGMPHSGRRYSMTIEPPPRVRN